MRTFSKAFTFFIIFAFIINFPLYASNKVIGKNGMVVSDHELASRIGIEILKKGGNAIDAAVGVGFALAVAFPYAGNIGGGGFMVLHLSNGDNTSIDFRETAPSYANKDMYLDEEGNYIAELSQQGITSVGIPGTVAGLIYAHEKYGKLNFTEIIQPSIDLAENGFILKEPQVKVFNAYFERLLQYESTAKVFSIDGEMYKTGDEFVQTDLAETLKLIRDNGRDGFYKGKTAELLVNQFEQMGKELSLTDLEKYEPIEKSCIEGEYQSYKIISMPPPSSGGIAIVEALNILSNFDINKSMYGSSEYYHLLSETLKYVYADRSKHIGDPAFYDVPVKNLISSDVAKEISRKIADKAVPSNQIAPVDFKLIESDETTHYSAIDKDGNAVSVTYTVNSAFGSKIVVDGAGFLLNNEMDDFSAKPGEPNQFGLLGSEANSIQPGKRMVSSMTPTIVLKDDKPFLIVGSPGGSKIITAVLQTIINVLNFGMNLNDAVDLPRIHHQWMPDKIYYDEYAISEDVKNNLIKMGCNISENPSTIGRVNAILIDENNIYWGHSDRRGYGTAIGY